MLYLSALSTSVGKPAIPGCGPPQQTAIGLNGSGWSFRAQEPPVQSQGLQRGGWVGPGMGGVGLSGPLKACEISNQSDNSAQGVS